MLSGFWPTVAARKGPAHSWSMQLSRVVLRVRSPEKLASFYTGRFGMRARAEGQALVLGFGGDDASIELRQATSGEAYLHRREDRYWKIGITLPNVDIAHAQLCEAGVAVSRPKQFGEIGYMCHLEDTEGFSIELLQHRFEGHRGEGDGDPEVVLGGGARIGQITLRIADLDSALGFYRDRLGMMLLSIQPVMAYGFTLYFLAFTGERPPNPDLEAVENREWIWQRPYTTLELQHFACVAGALTLPDDDEPGFAGLVITGASDRAARLADDGGGEVELLR